MKININNKKPKVKPINELTEGEIFKIAENYFIITNLTYLNNNNKITCINLRTGEARQINPTEQITPVEAELNIYEG